MNESREAILAAIRKGLKVARLPEASTMHPMCTSLELRPDLAEFLAELERASAQTHHVETSQQATQLVRQLLAETGAGEVLAWHPEKIGCLGLAETLDASGVRLVYEGAPQDVAHIQFGLTGADAGLADTGTLVLRAGPGCSPLASLLPPVHIALLPANRVYGSMSTYWASLGDPARHVQDVSQLLFITGPSRTADIEQVLTLGVHGPRTLHVVVWG